MFDRKHPDLAVADLAGTRRIHDAFGECDLVAVVAEDLQLHLRNEVDRVLRTSVHLGVAALAAESLHLGDRQALHAELLHGRLHIVQLERLDDRNDELHSCSSGSVSCAPESVISHAPGGRHARIVPISMRRSSTGCGGAK